MTRIIISIGEEEKRPGCFTIVKERQDPKGKAHEGERAMATAIESAVDGVLKEIMLEAESLGIKTSREVIHA